MYEKYLQIIYLSRVCMCFRYSNKIRIIIIMKKSPAQNVLAKKVQPKCGKKDQRDFIEKISSPKNTKENEDHYVYIERQGPFVQSIISLTPSLVVKMLTDLVSTIQNSQLFLLKNVSSFCKCKNISIYAIFNDQSFRLTIC